MSDFISDNEYVSFKKLAEADDGVQPNDYCNIPVINAAVDTEGSGVLDNYAKKADLLSYSYAMSANDFQYLTYSYVSWETYAEKNIVMQMPAFNSEYKGILLNEKNSTVKLTYYKINIDVSDEDVISNIIEESDKYLKDYCSYYNHLTSSFKTKEQASLYYSISGSAKDNEYVKYGSLRDLFHNYINVSFDGSSYVISYAFGEYEKKSKIGDNSYISIAYSYLSSEGDNCSSNVKLSYTSEGWPSLSIGTDIYNIRIDKANSYIYRSYIDKNSSMMYDSAANYNKNIYNIPQDSIKLVFQIPDNYMTSSSSSSSLNDGNISISYFVTTSYITDLNSILSNQKDISADFAYNNDSSLYYYEASVDVPLTSDNAYFYFCVKYDDAPWIGAYGSANDLYPSEHVFKYPSTGTDWTLFEYDAAGEQIYNKYSGFSMPSEIIKSESTLYYCYSEGEELKFTTASVS